MTTRIADSVRVVDTSEVAAARRVATQCAGAQRLSETFVAKAALVTTELATNLLKHGGGGSILFGSDDLYERALTIVALDKGRGIGNVAAAMSDGFSTAGSPGTGLGAIARAASFLDIYAFEDRGTVVLCRIGEEPRRGATGANDGLAVAGICVPKTGEEQPGDSWFTSSHRDFDTIGVIDGLGHGPAASTASLTAVRAFVERPESSLDELLRDAHRALRPTRGAAVGLARVFRGASRLEFAGIGNIAATIAGDESARRTVSLNGIVGHEMRKVQTFSYPWSDDSVLVVQSDGLSTNWNLAAYPGLLQHDPALIAAVLYRDHCRGTDDATVVVAKAA